jgi:uncharacterized protein YjbI with pentapeptide repeats
MMNSRKNNQEATMRKISTAKLRKWVLVGLGFGAVVSAVLGTLPICDYGQGLALNLATELAGALVTYVLLQLVIGRREEKEAKKADLIAQLGSQVPGMAIAAAEELRRHGWLYDGSLQRASLGGANLQGANLIMADLQEAFLNGANLQKTYLFRANLQKARLAGAELQRADLTYTNLQEAYLAEAKLQKAFLVQADLQQACLPKTNLQGVLLAWANLKGAYLEKADLQGAILVGADLQGANLREANLERTEFNKGTTLPDGTKWTPDTDMARFTDPNYPDFWRPDA